MIFVCVTSIGVKSKYGSCSGNCTGMINFNNKIKKGKILGKNKMVRIQITYVF